MAGVAVALASLFAGMSMRARAGRELTSAQASQVLTIGLMQRTVRVVLGMGLALWLLTAWFFLGLPLPSPASWSTLIGCVVAGLWLHISFFRQLRAAGLPSSYIRAHEQARLVAYVGLALCVAILFLSLPII